MPKELVMPHDRDAEIVVLGSILIDEKLLPLVMRIIQAECFYEVKHQYIFQAMVDLYEHEREVSFITIVRQLEIKGNLDFIGGPSAIIELNETMGVTTQALEAAHVILEMSIYRQGTAIAAKLAHLAYHKDPEMLSIIMQELQELEHQSTQGTQNFYRMADIAGPYISELSARNENKGKTPKGITTGFIDLDRMMRWQKSDVIVIAARPAIGKTTIMLNLARNAAMAGFHVVIFSLEMSKEQLFTKFLSMGIRMNGQHLNNGDFDDDGWTHIVAGIGELTNLNISICDVSGLSIQDIQLMAKTLHVQNPIDIIMIDYMQRIHATMNGKRIENEFQSVTEVSREIKHLARELDIPIIALSQLSRNVESRQSKIPQLSDLRQSGQIEQDASVVIMPYRDEVYNPDTERKNMTDLIIVKHRNGPIGEVTLYHDLATSRYMNLEVNIPEE